MSSYLAFFSIPFLFLVAVLMLILRLAVPRFAYSWLIAAFGALVPWPLLLLSWSGQPHLLELGSWSVPGLSPTSPTLILDNVSWPFAFSLVTLALAVLLTDAARAGEADWSVWTACLLLSPLGLIAVFAGNPLTLMLAWAASDLAELLIFFWHVRSSVGRERVMAMFAARGASIFLLAWGWFSASHAQQSLTFTEIPPQAGIYLVLAAWMRLGIVPLHLPRLQERPVRRSLGTLSRLVSAAGGLVLLARSAVAGVAPSQMPFLLFLAGGSGLYAAFSWFYAADELEGRMYWIIAASALAMASAVRGQPAVCLAWGVGVLLSGGLIFLYSARQRYLVFLPILGMLNFSALPFTPTWLGSGVFDAPLTPWHLLLLATLAFLLAGYYRLGSQAGQPLSVAERWVWLIYGWGLSLIPISHLIIPWRLNALHTEATRPLSLITVWPGPVVVVLAVLVFALYQRGIVIPERGHSVLSAVLSLNWLYRLVWMVYRLVSRLVRYTSIVLEGEGGVLWALLWLLLLLAFLAQRGLRGI